jgi:hypothetical protein
VLKVENIKESMIRQDSAFRHPKIRGAIFSFFYGLTLTEIREEEGGGVLCSPAEWCRVVGAKKMATNIAETAIHSTSLQAQ